MCHYFTACWPRCLKAVTTFYLSWRLRLVYPKLCSIDKSIKIHHTETKVVTVCNNHCKEWGPCRFSGVHVPQQHWGTQEHENLLKKLLCLREAQQKPWTKGVHAHLPSPCLCLCLPFLYFSIVAWAQAPSSSLQLIFSPFGSNFPVQMLQQERVMNTTACLHQIPPWP